jgi:hypothetical protein
MRWKGSGKNEYSVDFLMIALKIHVQLNSASSGSYASADFQGDL